MTQCTLERSFKIGKLTENINVEIDIKSRKLKSSCCISTFVIKVNHSKMSSRTLIKVFGHIVFSFTREVTKHYNPEDLNLQRNHLATIHWKALVENGIIIL